MGLTGLFKYGKNKAAPFPERILKIHIGEKQFADQVSPCSAAHLRPSSLSINKQHKCAKTNIVFHLGEREAVAKLLSRLWVGILLLRPLNSRSLINLQYLPTIIPEQHMYSQSWLCWNWKVLFRYVMSNCLRAFSSFFMLFYILSLIDSCRV